MQTQETQAQPRRLNSVEDLRALPSGTVLSFCGKPSILVREGEEFSFMYRDEVDRKLPAIMTMTYNFDMLTLSPSGGIVSSVKRTIRGSNSFIDEDNIDILGYRQLNEQLLSVGI